jgi:hypothetical protein
MAFRTVGINDAKTAEDAKAWVVADTGGACIPTGLVKEISGGWAVEVYSLDGRASMPLHVIQNLAAIGRDADGNLLEERPQYESVGPDPRDQKLDSEPDEPKSDVEKYNSEMRKMLDDLKPKE